MASAQDPAPGTASAASRSAPAPETRRLYAADWAGFVAWCHGRGWPALPADAATVAAYLQDAAGRWRAGTLARRLAAIADQHRQHGRPSPTRDPLVKAVLRAARGTGAPRRPAPAAAQLLRLAAGCPRDLAGLRDRALLLLAAHGLGRAALVGLDAEQIQFDNTGVALRVRDPRGGAARTLGLARGAERGLCPVHALETWQQASETRFGPLFRKIDRWGTLEHDRLGTDAIRRILARRTRRTPRVDSGGRQASARSP